MQQMPVEFDAAGFFRSVEFRRQKEGLSWRELARKLELSPSTFSRLAQGRRPDVETFVRLLAWLEMPAESFMLNSQGGKDGANRPDALSAISSALRGDPRLNPEDVEPIEEIVKVAYRRFAVTR